MRRVALRLFVNSVLLGAALLTFGSGLVLLIAFHVNEGATRASALGLGRLAWLNLHRLPALATLVGLGVHGGVNWKAFTTKLRRISRRDGGRRSVTDSLLCLALLTVALSGLAVWLLVGGSAPLLGPAPLGPAPGFRHHLVNVHNVAGLVALPCAVRHVGRRWRWMVRTFRSLAR